MKDVASFAEAALNGCLAVDASVSLSGFPEGFLCRFAATYLSIYAYIYIHMCIYIYTRMYVDGSALGLQRAGLGSIFFRGREVWVVKGSKETRASYYRGQNNNCQNYFAVPYFKGSI